MKTCFASRFLNFCMFTDSLVFSLQNLYKLLLNALYERGINNDFARDLLDTSTVIEHKEYVNFLQDLKGFFSAKYVLHSNNYFQYCMRYKEVWALPYLGLAQSQSFLVYRSNDEIYE